MVKTREIIKNFLITEVIPDGKGNDLTDADLLVDSGLIDSMGILALLSFLEDEFSVEILDDELMPENFDSIETISTLIDRKLGFELEA